MSPIARGTINPTTEQLVQAGLTCQCWSGRRNIPVRFGVPLLRAVASLAPETIVATYRCSDCGEIIEVRAKALGLVALSA